MAASVTLPTQALPPYLSASSFTVTEVGGVQSTGVTTVEVPLTYFGPSIPLGPDDVWTFGGSTSPPSTAASTASSTALSTTPTSTSTSATPTTSQSQSNTQSTSQSTNATSSSQSSGTQSSNGLTPTSAMGGSKGHHLSGGAIGGIVIAAVVFLIVVTTLLCLFAIRRRRKRDQQHLYENPNMSDFVIVDAEGQPRLAGEGVARPNGEEEDSFLQLGGEGSTMRERSARLVSARQSSGAETIGTIPAPEGVVPSALSTGASPTDTVSPLAKRANSPFFHASASSLFFNPNRGPDPSVAAAAGSGASKRDSASTQQSSGRSLPAIQGAIIPRHELLQMEGQWNQESGDTDNTAIAARHGVTELGERVPDEDYPGTPLRPPPILNPDAIRPTMRPDSVATAQSVPDTPGSEDERATFLTARRVRMDEAGPSTLVSRDEGTSATPSAWSSGFSGLGLGGLARLSRLSWFQRMEAVRGSTSGRSGSSEGGSSGNGGRSRANSPSSGLAIPRPISHVSTGSRASRASSTGDSNYQDARSTMTMSSGNNHADHGRSSPIPPVPVRSGLSQSPSPPRAGGDSEARERDLPALPEPIQPSSSPSRAQRNSQTDNTLIDILDVPAPRPTSSQFSTASSRGGPMLPPGLEHLAVANVHSWRESGSDMPSPTSISGSGGGVTIGSAEMHGDALEEEPPRPRAGWTHLRSVAGATVDAARRGTLGQSLLVDIEENPTPLRGSLPRTSERDSVQSLPLSLPGPTQGRLSPFSPVGSGGSNSLPRSRSRHSPSSLGSGSSRSHFSQDDSNSRSGHGHNNNNGSGSQLQHSNSVRSADQQRRFERREPGEPLTSASMQSLSAFGPAPSTPARLSAIGGSSIRLVGSSTSLERHPHGALPTDLDPDATFSTVTGVTSQTSMSDISGASHETRSTVLDAEQTEGQTPEQFVHLIIPVDPNDP